MDNKFWASLNATRRAMEQANLNLDAAKFVAVAETARQFGSISEFAKLPATLDVGREAILQYEGFSANLASVRETITSVIARLSEQPNLTLPVMTNALLAFPQSLDLRVHETPLISTRIHEIAQLNAAVIDATKSVQFDKLEALNAFLGRRLVRLSDSYREIFARLPKLEFVVPAFVTELPARDMVVKSTIVSSRARNFELDEAKMDLDDPAYARSDVDLMLADLNPDYVRVLDEAFEAFSGRSLGRVRHVLVSLRELITHVLHDLSPDTELRAWSTDPSLFEKGKPTRAARYLYICRFVGYGPYGEYVKKSSRMTSAFFEALNCLHDVRPDIREFQLRLMVTDALNILRFILRTARYRT